MQTKETAKHPQADPGQQETRRRRCRHIFTAGRQCGSPCLRGEQFCYYHHTTRRPVADPRNRQTRASANASVVLDLPNPEDRDAIRDALGQVLHALAQDAIAPHRASVLIYTLQTSLAALPRESAASQAQTVGLSAAASRKPKPVKHILAQPLVEETFLDDAHGLIAPETFLEEEQLGCDTRESGDEDDEHVGREDQVPPLPAGLEPITAIVPSLHACTDTKSREASSDLNKRHSFDRRSFVCHPRRGSAVLRECRDVRVPHPHRGFIAWAGTKDARTGSARTATNARVPHRWAGYSVDPEPAHQPVHLGRQSG